MEKLSEIPWDIPNDKWIEHKFEHYSSLAQMTKQKIAINLQNMISYLEFLMRHLSFWHNQIYKPSHIYNENE